ncbi:MAG: hypothetical protein L0287_20465 [Anaerolineae bacterium]|nr:hypothetical protein [Anaerolineae bacterium]MCI0610146.1 hypothetical protein [Anaerolineae bacterium]
MSHRFFGRSMTLFRLLGIGLVLSACTAAPATPNQIATPQNTLPAIETPIVTSSPDEANCSSLRSIEGSVETVITFLNASGRAIKVYWVNYEGAEEFWFELQPGQSQVQGSFVTHAWCVRDRTSNTALLEVVATQAEQFVTIGVTDSTVTIVPTPSPNPLNAIAPVLDPTLGIIQWAETNPMPIPSAAPFDSLRSQQLIFHNGYVYIFGGRNASDERLTNVYFSAIRLDGTLVGWVETTPLPGHYYDHVVVKVGNYVYLLTGAAGVDDVYYAPFNPDGSIGAWKETASLSPSRQTFAAVSYGNFIYAAGGNSGGIQNFVQYTSVKPDGSLNPWNYTVAPPQARQEHTMISYDGYLYIIGGKKADDQWVNTVYFSAIQPDGTLADWKTTTPLPKRIFGHGTFESNGHVYFLGNNDSYYTRIREDHTLAEWQAATSLPSRRHGLRVGANNGFVYAIGGYDSTTYQNTAYYGGLGLQLSAESPIVDHPDCTSGWTRLKVGQEAKVSEDDSLTNRVRLGPGTNEPMVALLYPGTIVKLIEGPICADGVIFWKVGSYPTGIGWTAEGDGRKYFLEPVR